VVVVEGNAESVPKIRITEKHFQVWKKLNQLTHTLRKRPSKPNQKYRRDQYWLYPRSQRAEPYRMPALFLSPIPLCS
jgi:hypothetical protein